MTASVTLTPVASAEAQLLEGTSWMYAVGDQCAVVQSTDGPKSVHILVRTSLIQMVANSIGRLLLHGSGATTSLTSFNGK